MAMTVGVSAENEALRWIVKGQQPNAGAGYKMKLLDDIGDVIIFALSPGSGDGGFGYIFASSGETIPDAAVLYSLAWTDVNRAVDVSTLLIAGHYNDDISFEMPIAPPITLAHHDNLYLDGSESGGLAPAPNRIKIVILGATDVSTEIGYSELMKAILGTAGSLMGDTRDRLLRLYDDVTTLPITNPGEGYNEVDWVPIGGDFPTGGWTNSNRVIFNDMPACTVGIWEVSNTNIGAKVLFQGPLTTPVSVSAGEKFVFQPGDLNVRLIGV